MGSMMTVATVCLAVLCGSAADAQTPAFALREMDMHLHAGLEREVPLNEWMDLAVADGRKAFILLDHLELYRMSAKEYREWSRERDGRHWYPMGAKGHRALMVDFDKAAAARPDLLIFKGWEIGEDELDEGLEDAPMDLVDVIGWHISPNSDEGPGGRMLIKRIEQIKQVQQRHPVPMIVFHPFSMHLERVVRDAEKAGKDPKSLSVGECRFFKPGEQNEVIRLLKDTSIYIEMAHGTEGCWNNPVMREALIADIKPLADAGVKFTVSTDNHYLGHARKPFHPEVYCEPCGITEGNANALIRELSARKAKEK
jgi:hypothetical protein